MDYKKLLESLPVRPGDTVYYVWKSKDGWRLSEERVRSVLFGEDGKLRMMITNTKEKTFIYGEDMVFRTLEEAIKQYTVLTAGIVPRPRETGPVNIVTRAGRIVRGFYITPGSDLPEGFFDMEREEITMVDIFMKKIRIPDEDVLAW